MRFCLIANILSLWQLSHFQYGDIFNLTLKLIFPCTRKLSLVFLKPPIIATLYLFEDFSFFQLTVLVLNDAGLMQKKVIKMMFKKSHEFTFFVLKKQKTFINTDHKFVQKVLNNVINQVRGRGLFL